jgi:hypothetical protein
MSVYFLLSCSFAVSLRHTITLLVDMGMSALTKIIQVRNIT